MESAFINATIITEFVLESGLVLAGPTGPVPPIFSPVTCTHQAVFVRLGSVATDHGVNNSRMVRTIPVW